MEPEIDINDDEPDYPSPEERFEQLQELFMSASARNEIFGVIYEIYDDGYSEGYQDGIKEIGLR